MLLYHFIDTFSRIVHHNTRQNNNIGCGSRVVLKNKGEKNIGYPSENNIQNRPFIHFFVIVLILGIPFFSAQDKQTQISA